ncbi:MAG: lysylphosphatidylglycerol synthase transmembrane domain-containing protein [Bacteroidales bacterium]
MKAQIRRYTKVLISLLLGILLLWLITRGQDIDLLIREFRNANYQWIILAMISAVISHFLRALRWNMLIGAMGYQTQRVQTFMAVMTGYLANMAIPRMGEITRCVTLSRASKTPFNALAGTVVAERVFDVISILAIILITILAQFTFLKSFLNNIFLLPLLKRGSEQWLAITAIILVGVTLLITVVIFLHNKLKHASGAGFFYKLKRQLQGFKEGIKSIKKMRGKGWFILYTLLIWGLYYMTVYLCFFAIDATSHLTPIVGLTLLAVGSLGIMAPVPGGIGTYHFLTIITLSELYGIASEPATSYAYITHATQLIVNLSLGTISWFILAAQHKKKL